jgi:hypothetical protein
MFKKTITFEDFNGVKHTEDFYFHVAKADIIAMGVGAEALQDRIARIVASKDGHGIIKQIRFFIELGAGRRSEDGSQFLQTQEIKQAFMSSPACDELLVELCTNAQASVDFITNLIPEKTIRELAATAEKNSAGSTETVNPFADTRPAWLKENRAPTQAELVDMSAEELKMAFRQSGK